MDWYYWVIVLGVLVLFYVLTMVRQKKQQKQQEEAQSSLRVGDKVITHIGIFGKIKRIYNTTYGKVCVLEVGVNNKVDIEMDLRYVAALDEKTVAPEEPTKVEPAKKEEPKQENVTKTNNENTAEPTTEPNSKQE